MIVFADTPYFIALLNGKDAAHSTSLIIRGNSSGRLW